MLLTTHFTHQIASLFTAAGLALAITASPASGRCFNMESPPPGATYPVGFSLALPDVTISIDEFQYSGGGWAGPAHDANIVVSNEALGSAVQEIMVDNCTIVFEPDPPAKAARFRYADLGGNTNFEINGDFRNVADLSMLDGFIVGGHLVTVVWVSGLGFERGILTVHPAGPPIDLLRVGGQEFFLDDLCYRR
ncbi:MAG: hypothetical protein CME06_04425 [Gemmatimonadetes bacterium]|nr:hypothetical protein [Gemmatimonadota bacterium]